MDPRLFVLSSPAVRERACRFISNEAPAGFRVRVEQAKRNSAINAALHAKLGEIAERVKWAGQLHDIDTWKRLLVGAWSRTQGEPVTMLPALDGNGVEIVFRRTSAMTQAEVHELLVYIESWCAERPEFAEEHA